MSLQSEAMRASAMRAKFSKKMTNGLSTVSPLWYLITMGIQKGSRDVAPIVENWRGDIGWGGASGTQYSWQITKTLSTADVNTDTLRTRDFEETDLIDTATVSYYNVERTWAVSPGDLDLNKNDESKKASIRKTRRVDAEAACQKELLDIPHNINETNQNGGLSMYSPTSVGASTTYAGIAMDAGAYWQCTGYDYGSLTIAANFFDIFDALRRQLRVSKNAGGGGGLIQPDFAYCDPTAWTNVVTYYSSKLSINISDGNRPQNTNMFNAGFNNMLVNNIVFFDDENTGGATGYIDAVATEEIMMGHSSKMHLVTTASKKQGFLRAEPSVKDNPAIAGELGLFKTGLFAFYVESPRFFQVAHT